MSTFDAPYSPFDDNPRRPTVGGRVGLAETSVPMGAPSGISPFSPRGRAIQDNTQRAKSTGVYLRGISPFKAPPLPAIAGRMSYTGPDGKTITKRGKTPVDMAGYSAQVNALRSAAISQANDEAEYLADGVRGSGYTLNRNLAESADARLNAESAAGVGLTGAKTDSMRDWSKHVTPFVGQELASKAKVNDANAVRTGLLAPIEEETGRLANKRYQELTPWSVTAAERGLDGAAEQVKNYRNLVTDQGKVISSLKSGQPAQQKPATPFIRSPRDLTAIYDLMINSGQVEEGNELVRQVLPSLLGSEGLPRTGQDPRFATPFTPGPTTRPTAGPTTRPSLPFNLPPDVGPTAEQLSLMGPLTDAMDSASMIGTGPGAAMMGLDLSAPPSAPSSTPATISPAFSGQSTFNKAAGISPSLSSSLPFTPPPASPTAMPTPKTPEEAAKLPKGTRFRDPNGVIRIR